MQGTLRAEWARIYGDDGGTGISLAPYGTATDTITDLTPTLPSEFVYAGWLDQSGIQLEISKDISKFRGLQGGRVVKTRITEVGQMFNFICLEDSKFVAELAFNSEVTVAGTGPDAIATQNITTGLSRMSQRAMVVDALEGEIIDRYVSPLVEIAYQGTLQIANLSEIRAFSFTAEVIEPMTRISNSPGMVAA